MHGLWFLFCLKQKSDFSICFMKGNSTLQWLKTVRSQYLEVACPRGKRYVYVEYAIRIMLQSTNLEQNSLKLISLLNRHFRLNSIRLISLMPSK